MSFRDKLTVDNLLHILRIVIVIASIQGIFLLMALLTRFLTELPIWVVFVSLNIVFLRACFMPTLEGHEKLNFLNLFKDAKENFIDVLKQFGKKERRDILGNGIVIIALQGLILLLALFTEFLFPNITSAEVVFVVLSICFSWEVLYQELESFERRDIINLLKKKRTSV